MQNRGLRRPNKREAEFQVWNRNHFTENYFSSSVPKRILQSRPERPIEMYPQTSNSSSAHGTSVLIRADQNLIPPSLRLALTEPPKVNNKPFTVEMLAGAALRALLALSASPASVTPTTTNTSAITTSTAITGTAQSAPAEPSPYLTLPPEKRFDVFRWAVRMHGRDSSLFSLSKTSKDARAEVIAFLNDDNEGRAFRTILLKGEIPKWKANAEELAANAKALSKTASHIDLPRGSATGIPAKATETKVVKVTAAGIGRERVLAEVPALLSEASSSIKIALNLSGNGLTAQDLEALLRSLERKPIVYQLSLDNNPLCHGDEVCAPLVRLFSYMGPTSHLYLSNVGLNDATAAAIQPSLAKSRTLLHVDLRNNSLTTAGGIAVVAGIVPGTNVKTVRLQGNAFGWDYDVAETVSRAHLRIEEKRREELGAQYNPTVNMDPVEIVQIDGVSSTWIRNPLVNHLFQEKFEEAAFAQRI